MDDVRYRIRFDHRADEATYYLQGDLVRVRDYVGFGFYSDPKDAHQFNSEAEAKAVLPRALKYLKSSYGSTEDIVLTVERL